MIHLFLVGLILGIFLVGVLYQKESLLKVVTLGTTGFFFSYVLASAVLFWLDLYSIQRALFAVVILLGILSIYVLIKKKERPIFTFELKEWGVLLLILLLVLPATLGKFEFFGMGQDQGVYQTKAIELINGNNQRIFDFDEIELLNEEQREDYYKTVSTLAGYDLLDDSKFSLQNIEEVSETAGIYHGIPTWTAILAMFGELFGISNMQQCQTVFFILYLLLLFYILENLKIKTVIEVPALLILGFSPQILWVSKSALTEMFLAVIIACFMMLILEKKESMRFFSFVPIFVFSFFHVTIYTMMPLFVLVYWGLYFIKKEKKYIRASSLCLIGYFVGFIFMMYISPTYTTNNYVRPLSILKFVTDSSLIFVVFAVTIVALFVTYILPKLAKNNKVAIIKDWLYQRRTILLKLLVLCLLALFVLRYIGSDFTIDDIGYMNLVSYAIASGILLLPAVLISLFFMKTSQLVGGKVYVIFTVFIYTVIAYSIFLRFDLRNLYYYGRYLVPYVFVIIVVFCYLLNRCKRYHIWMLCFLGGVFFIKPNKVLLTELDDTRLSWNVLEDTMDVVNSESVAIIVSDEHVRTMFLPLKSVGASVFNEWENVDSQMEFLGEYYKNVYYLTNRIDGEDKYTLTYRNEYVVSEYDSSKHQDYSQYPLEVLQGKKIIYLYKYHQEQLLYNVCDQEFEGAGFGSIENDSFAWTGNKGASISCYLEKRNYEVTITQGAGIPLDSLDIDKYDINVYVNNEYLITLTVDKENNGKDLSFYLSEEFLKDKKNVITYEYEPWSPSDFGLADNRQIGFGFSQMEFKAQ